MGAEGLTMTTQGNQGHFFGREVSGMPEGYYSGDKPNPNLKAFIEQHIKEQPYDLKSDNYSIGPMTDQLQVERSEPVYEMHSYWSKKPPSAIDTYIAHYTKPGDVVLDPFCGSGTSLVSALRLGRHCIGIDLSPAATFISSGYVYPFDSLVVNRAFNSFISALESKCA
ncbi:MAG: site-specific DNA-methyltransferase, partial [Chloroflexi bacterium]|nr:site-specific DNA-methyltransferase [Chloroflexota bacterium]